MKGSGQMLIEILQSLLILVLVVLSWYLTRKQEKLEQRQVSMALRMKDLDNLLTRVDESTGKAIHDMKGELQSFIDQYGEAAIEEKREVAKAEKAWADGLNNIMSYGANLHGRGDRT